MIVPFGGPDLPGWGQVLWWLTILVLGVAGLVALRRWRRGMDLRRGPVLNWTVRGFGALAAVLFAGYWWASDDVRQVEAAYDDVVEMLGIGDDPDYGGRFTDDPEGTCRRTGEQVRLLSSQTTFDRVGEQLRTEVAPEAVPVWEDYARRAEADGWTVRRFVAGGELVASEELRIWAERGGSVFSLQHLSNVRPVLTVTRDDCLGENLVPLNAAGGRLRDGWREVDEFEQP